MSTPKQVEAKPTPELLLAMSDPVAGLHECELASRWALVGEAVEDFEIQRGQVVIVTAYDDDENNDNPGRRADMVLLAGPAGMRLGRLTVVEVEPCK